MRKRVAVLVVAFGLMIATSAWATPGPLTPPQPVSPLSGSEVVFGGGLGFALVWNSVPSGTWARAYLSAAGGGANLLPCSNGAVDPNGCWVQTSNAQTTNITVKATLTAGNYTWWVQSWEAGSTSAWSPGQTFKVVTERFEDLGKTVLDHLTGLEWEKKVSSTSNSIHYYANTYTWSLGAMGTPPSYPPNGTAFTTFLAGLNAGPCVGSSSDGINVNPGQDCSFAAHGDWRLPTISELSSIPCFAAYPSCIPPIFGTTNGTYWSSSELSSTPSSAWGVDFESGSSHLVTTNTSEGALVIAVRANRMPAANSGPD
jgi:hypothetical protein